MKCVDLNCDMGEVPESLADGSQEALMQYVSSANIACGGHAGDVQMMRTTIEQAVRRKIAVGAHPGYEDRVNFGRQDLQLTSEQISASVNRQILALEGIAQHSGTQIGHVKPHGALYNRAACDRKVAHAIAEGVRRWKKDVILVGLAGSVMLEEFCAMGFAVAAEAFADRRYEQDGSLRSRKFEDALLRDPQEAAEQALSIVQQGNLVAADGSSISLHADTICIHGDTPGALEIAAAIHRRLTETGIAVRSLPKGK